MVLYIFIIFLIFVMASIYKNRSNTSMLFIWGIFLGWIISIACLILYLSRQNYYWSEVNNIFYITPKLWNILITQIQISADALIRGVNIGVGLVYYCAVCFGIAFTSKKNKENNKKYLILAIVPLAEIIFFDPLVQKCLQAYISNAYKISFKDYTIVCNYLGIIFKTTNIGYCISMLYKLANYYITHPKIKFLKIYTLFNIICICPITLSFYYIFKWYPIILIKATMKKGYYNYLVPNFQIELLNNRIFYLIFFIAYTALGIYIYKYSTMENYYRRDHKNINISIDTASLGVNTFTHAIKNHIQGIRTEAEYLSKRYEVDEEVRTSTRLILESCSFCFASIENANKQLKNIDLNLKLIPIEQPIKQVLERFQGINKEINISYEKNKQNTMAYIDEKAFIEVLVNLISNAIEAIDEKPGGKIEMSIREQGGWGILEIKDSGKGIETENLSKIFTPFFSTKSSINNWGVGLAFCYKVVTAHDGKITVESELGKGTIFSIALPII